MFTTEFGTPVDPRNLLWVIETAVKTAGVDGVGIHILRHSAAVAWLESGVHIKAVADARERRSSLSQSYIGLSDTAHLTETARNPKVRQ